MNVWDFSIISRVAHGHDEHGFFVFRAV